MFQRRLFWAVLGVLALGVGACVAAFALREPAYLTVAGAWANAEALNGRRVVVRGWASFVPWQTLATCRPPVCACNRSEGQLTLLEHRPLSGGGFVSPQRIFVSGLDCRGDECSLTCTPFDPRTAPAFELVGTLRVEFSQSSAAPQAPPVAALKRFACPGIRRLDLLIPGLVRSPGAFCRQIFHLNLDEIDLADSRQLVGSGDLHSLTPQPLSTGRFDIPLRQP